MSAVDPERRIAVLNESIQSYRCCLINMKVVTEGSSIARMPERHGGMVGILVDFFRYTNGPLQTSRRQIPPSLASWWTSFIPPR